MSNNRIDDRPPSFTYPGNDTPHETNRQMQQGLDTVLRVTDNGVADPENVAYISAQQDNNTATGSRRLVVILAPVVLIAGIVSLYYVWKNLPTHITATKINAELTGTNKESDKMIVETDKVAEAGEIIRAAAEAHRKALEMQAAADQAKENAAEETRKADERVNAAETTARMEQELRLKAEKETQTEKELRLKAEEELSQMTKERPIEPEVSRFGVRVAANNGFGVRITGVTDGSVGHEAGLQRDDVIFIIDGKRLTSPKDFSDAVDNSDERMVLNVGKADSERIIEITFVLPKIQREQ